MRRWHWLALFALALALFGFEDLDAIARPGGGHSYSGSSSFSGGGGGGGGSSGGGLVYLLIHLVLRQPQIGVPIAVVVVAFVVISKRKNDGLGDWDSGESMDAGSAPDLEEIRRLDAEFSEVLFTDFAYALYAQAHMARSSKKKLAELAPYLVANVRQALHHRNPVGVAVVGVVVGAMRVESLHVPHETQDAEGHVHYAQIVLTFESNVTVGSDSDRQTHYCGERWTFARAATAKSRPPKRAQSLRCPNCDAAFDSADETVCAYCNQVVTSGRFEWLVTGVTLMSLEARPPALVGHAVERGTKLATVWHDDVDERLAGFYAADPRCTEATIGARLQLIYNQLNAAWSHLSLIGARPYVSDGMVGYLGYWVHAYNQRGLVNKIDKAHISGWEIVKVVADKHFVSLTIRLFASGLDYTVEQASGNVVGGSQRSPRAYSEYWTLVRSASARGAARGDKTCPSCAAELKINQGGNCEFCGSHITSGEFDWVLSKIEQDEAYAG